MASLDGRVYIPCGPTQKGANVVTYDDREARWIFAKAAAEIVPAVEGRDRAGIELLGAFIDLVNGCKGLDAERSQVGGRTAHVVIPRIAEAWVIYSGEGKFILKADGVEPATIQFVYDEVEGKLVGAEDDTYITPTPGEPRAKRSALAVLAEATVDLLTRPGKVS